MRTFVISTSIVIFAALLAFLFGNTIETAEDKTKKKSDQETAEVPQEQSQKWTCPMHPAVRKTEEGLCPICEMELVPVEEGAAFSASEISKAGIRTTPVKRTFVTRRYELYGKVEADETRETSITAWVRGRIEKIYRNHHGMNIQKGEKLLELYSPELKSTHQELLLVRDRLQNASRETRRQELQRELSSIKRRLRDWGVPDDTINKLKSMDEATDTVTISAPTGGTIHMIHRDEGEWVKRGDTIYDLVDLNRVWITLFPYETDLAHLRLAQKAVVEAEAYPGEQFTGRIGFINRFLHEPTRSVHTHIHAKNPSDKLKPGMFVTARLQSELSADGNMIAPAGLNDYLCKMHPSQSADEPGTCEKGGRPLVPIEELGYVRKSEAKAPLVVPETAPLLTGKRAVVYVLDRDASGRSDDTGEQSYAFQLREVQLGPKTQNHYIVKDGLKEGEQVVFRGAFKVDSERQIQGETSMMYREQNRGKQSGGHDH